MHKLGEYILRGRLQAIIVTSFLTLVSFLVPFLIWILSGLPPALVTLRKGAAVGLQVILGSVVVVALLVLLVRLNPQIALILAAGIWLPVWFCCTVLRRMESQGMAITAAGLCGLLYIFLTHGILDDVAGWWQNGLEVWLEQSVKTGQAEQLREVVLSAAPYINAMMAVGLVISLIVTVLLARWWQSRLYNPGGFRQEFHSLRLPRWLLLPVLAGMGFLALGQAGPGSLLLDVLILLVFLYLYQGLAMAHRTVAARKMSSAWLVGMYVLLFVLPQAVLLLACLGMVDSWLLRSSPAASNDNS